jgi:hypothetical protein
MQHKFWRLLSACELLARDETAALTARDFAALGAAQQVMSALLADLALQARLIHASRDSHARSRLLKLIECSQAGSRLLAAMKAASVQERHKLRAAVLQLQSLRAAYHTPAASRRGAFSAHG